MINTISSVLIFLSFCLITVSMYVQGYIISDLKTENVVLLIDSVVKFLEQVAWPITIVIIVGMFRSTISSVLIKLADRIKKIGKDGVELSPYSQISTKEDAISNEKTLEEALQNEPLINHYQKLIKEELQKGAEKENLSFEVFLLGKTSELYIAWHFERIYRTIFGSQIKALQYLNTDSLESSKDKIYTFYDSVQQSSPLIYDNYNFEAWLNYLKIQSLVIINGDNVTISLEGQGFLKYIVAHNYTANKFG